MSDTHPSIVALGFAAARLDATHRRLLREGETRGALEAVREAGGEYGRALGDVYRCFGPDDPQVFADADAVAAKLERLFAGGL